jgi:F0F1-type ATP synthase assembly protein I
MRSQRELLSASVDGMRVGEFLDFVLAVMPLALVMGVVVGMLASTLFGGPHSPVNTPTVRPIAGL